MNLKQFVAALTYAMIALALATCSGCAPDEPATPGISRACYRSFAHVLDAWQAANLRVPEDCRLLDQEYTVQLVSAAEMPCKGGPGEVVVGCTQSGARLISLLAGRDDLATTDSSVHEWTHALSVCATGVRDDDHARAVLWLEYGAETVEAQALANVTTGSCL